MSDTPNTTNNLPESAPDALYVDVVRTMAKGTALGKLSSYLREAVAAAQATGKPASLAVKLTVEAADGEGVLMKVRYEPTLKLPKKPEPASTYFASDAGDLTRHDPRQREFGFTAAAATVATTPEKQDSSPAAPGIRVAIPQA